MTGKRTQLGQDCDWLPLYMFNELITHIVICMERSFELVYL